MPDEPLPGLTPTNYQRTTGGNHLQWKPPSSEHLATMLPQYEIESLIGHGGMGAVYKGKQKSLDRAVAIKILPPEAAGDEEAQFVERFKNEARTMAKMNHPAIVHVYDFGETTEGQLYIVMEFIDGTDVSKMIMSQGRLPQDHALAITAHVCDALQYAHTHNVIHRDIKPANIMINMEGAVKVADFGLAKANDAGQSGLTKTNMAMGTPDYVAPEALIAGIAVDGRADIYAMGVMLYQMLTGSIPRGMFALPSKMVGSDPRYDGIITRAMQTDREARYQTAAELRRDLDVILTVPIAREGQTHVSVMMKKQPAQKPMARGPSSPAGPQGKSAKVPVREPGKAAAAAKDAGTEQKKSANLGWVIPTSISACVILGGAFFMRGKKAATVEEPAPAEIVHTAPIKVREDPKPAATQTSSTPKPKPAESKPAPAPAAVASGNEKWVDGLAQWFGGTQKSKAFVRESNGAARNGSGDGNLEPIPSSAPGFRDQAVRMRWHGTNPKADFQLYVRNSPGGGMSYRARVKAAKGGGWEVSLVGPRGMIGNQASALPADFKPEATHMMEFRAIGDRLSVTVDGKQIVDVSDTQLTTGHPIFSGHDLVIESFEYANLDPGGAAPALAAAKSSPASPIEPVLTNTLGMKFVPVPITGGPTGGQRVLFSVWDTRVQDYAAFATETKSEWAKPEFEQGPTHPAVNVSWDEATAFCAWLTEREGKAGKLGANERYRLPSDHEWSCAVGIGDQEDAAKLPAEKNGKITDAFPGGSAWPPPAGAGNYAGEELRPALAAGKFSYIKEVLAGTNDGFVNTSPVGSFAANRSGLYDLGGNVWQWCEDWIDGSQNDRVLRGASWGNGGRGNLMSSGRIHFVPGARNSNYGFRCVFAGSVATAAAPSVAVTPSAASTAPAPAMPAGAPASAPAAPVAPADPRLAQLAAGFKARFDADAQQPFDAALAALNKSYTVNGIARARAAAQAKGGLAEVTALDTEKSLVEKGLGVAGEDAPDAPESLKSLRSTYRTALAKIAAERDAKGAPLYDLYVKALDAYIAELTKADKIEQAQQVQALRDDIAAKAGSNAPKAPATDAKAGASTTAPTPTEIKGSSWRAAALWCLDAKGGSIHVTQDGKHKDVNTVKDLPTGRFAISQLDFTTLPGPGVVTDATLARLNGLRDLWRFSSGMAEVAGPGLEVFRTTPTVTKLSFHNAKQLKDEHLAPLGALKELKELAISGGTFTGAALQHLAACKKLQNLDIDGMALTAEQAGTLHTLFPELKSIRLGPGSMTEETLRVVGQFKWLESLNLVGNAALTDEMLAPLSGLTALRELNFSGCPKLNGMGLTAFAASGELRHLNVTTGGALVIGTALPVIAKTFPKLEALEVQVRNATDADIKALCAHPSLTGLTLYSTTVTDNWLASIATLPKLQYLSIWGDIHTAAGIERLLESKSLIHLRLNSGKNMDASVVPVLKKFKNLKILTLIGTPANAAADEIRKALPGCKVSTS